MRRAIALALLLAGLAGADAAARSPSPSALRASPPGGKESSLQALRARLPEDEILYFVLPDRFDNADRSNDRGGLTGDRLHTGFDPADKAFYHGGDLKGLLRRLDYIQGLGATALWIAPVFKNKPVQGGPGHESAAYHGYWITDFTQVDPHFGTNAELKILVDAAHARGLKVYLDIVVNHTADVIHYRECASEACPYRSIADYPWTRLQGVRGTAINDGFLGDDIQTPANFARLTRSDYAYTPYILLEEQHLKVPDWLNDPIYYHNRGSSLFRGESSTYGDFGGLDDVMTEHPRVIAGMIEIYGKWIDDFGIDGYRIDTAQHVNPAFWRAFVPAILARAAKRGIPNFHIFGEVTTDDVDVGRLARHTREDGLPATLDFAFKNAVRATVAGNAPTSLLARVYADDVLYEGGAAAALRQPTFTGNHDQGRFGWFLVHDRPQAMRDEQLSRDMLAHALMMFGRGVPTVYYGDEQGFAGYGDDQAARQDMFGSTTASYNEQPLIGTSATTATPRFDATHPLYRAIAQMARIRKARPELRRGTTRVRASGDAPGLFAFSRTMPGQGGETLVAINTSNKPIAAQVLVDATSMRWNALMGACAPASAAPGSYTITLPSLGFSVCAADGPAA